MTKAKTPVVEAESKAIDRWDDEGGAPASGTQPKGRPVEDQESYLEKIRPYSDAIAKIVRRVRSELRALWDADAAEVKNGGE
jgi:hypothetical protein